MRIFLSYAEEQRTLAEQVRHALAEEGYTVFFDRTDLLAGEGYHARIRRAISRSHVFVFLISPDSVVEGSYALSELRIAGELVGRRRRVLLPVMVQPVAYDRLPAEVSEVTVLEAQGDVPAEITAAVDRHRQRRRQGDFLRAAAAALAVAVAIVVIRRPALVPEAERVRLIGMATNQGWLLTFDIAAPHVREIFYKLDAEREFRSTGFQESRDRETGLPQPVYQIMLPGVAREQDVAVKYADATGREHGPYQLRFDPKVAFVVETKQVLRMTDWVSFREHPPGTLIAQFTQLVVYKNAFREIRYSVDDESLSKSLRFTVDWTATIPDIRDDEAFVEIPLSATFVAVKLFFVDGTESELKRIVIADSKIGGRREGATGPYENVLLATLSGVAGLAVSPDSQGLASADDFAEALKPSDRVLLGIHTWLAIDRDAAAGGRRSTKATASQRQRARDGQRSWGTVSRTGDPGERRGGRGLRYPDAPCGGGPLMRPGGFGRTPSAARFKHASLAQETATSTCHCALFGSCAASRSRIARLVR